MDEYDLRIISLGAGVQSSALYRMAVMGELSPRPDYAIFADTKQEPPAVYETLFELGRWGDIPIRVASRGDLGECIRQGANSTGQAFSVVPFWVDRDGRESQGRRQCTREFKVDVVKDEIRKILGLEKGERAAGRYRVEQWVGISADEAQRAKPSRYDWIVTRWPFLYDRPMRRAEIISWMSVWGFSEPVKSACIFCPFRRPIEYAEMRESDPDLFRKACEWDDAIRNKGASGSEQFIWRELRPLRELPSLDDLRGDDRNQLDLWGNECEGMCGV